MLDASLKVSPLEVCQELTLCATGPKFKYDGYTDPDSKLTTGIGY